MDNETNLRNFGLTEYEVKAYISLLKLGIATAEQISSIGKIPLPRVYDTLSELQKKGFVLISKGRPKKFRAQQPKKALENLIDLKKITFDKNLKIMKKDSKVLVSSLSKMPTEKMEKNTSDIWFTEKRNNISNILDEQKEVAKDEVKIFAGDLSWISENAKLIENILKKGIKIKALVHEPESEDWKNNIKLAKKVGIMLKVGYIGTIRGHIIDGKTISIATKSKNQLNGTQEEYELVTSNNPALVEALKENFEFWWNSLN
ncbi:MAG: TrmB family transcriptional regulator [Candidatus Aenigmarchaeota archaeon]|nr:TrmB family transcriptional regulator [Candidatus Aenigmarchaeota archaeon]